MKKIIGRHNNGILVGKVRNEGDARKHDESRDDGRIEGRKV